jgi:hypothetical protein
MRHISLPSFDTSSRLVLSLPAGYQFSYAPLGHRSSIRSKMNAASSIALSM